MDFTKLLQLRSRLDVETVELFARFLQHTLAKSDPNAFLKGVLRNALSSDAPYVEGERVKIEVKE